MIDFLKRLFQSDFVPHGYCMRWQSDVVWLHVISDAFITISYYSIPFLLVYFVRKRRDMPFHWIFLAFGIFIFACGTTHLMAIWTLWQPVYRLDGLVKAVTAIASLTTAIILVPLIPKMIHLPSPGALRSANEALHREVSERIGAEERVRSLNTELEQRVAFRTAELRDANAQLRNTNARLEAALISLQRSNQDLQQFAYVASHDLQEPLRMVGAYAQLLERNYKDHLTPEANEFIGFMVSGATRMEQLIDALLMYSRVDNAKLRSDPVDANSACDEALANLRIQIAESGAAIERSELPTIRGHHTQIVQLFQNLIGNALKFRSEQPPRIEIGAAETDGNWQFFIRDNGIGFDQKYAPRIFVIFQRLSRKTAGTGIGLALCKRIVERHGGRIWVESEQGKGSTFFFTFPVQVPEELPVMEYSATKTQEPGF
jgi:signal transduction histidine kinase